MAGRFPAGRPRRRAVGRSWPAVTAAIGPLRRGDIPRRRFESRAGFHPVLAPRSRRGFAGMPEEEVPPIDAAEFNREVNRRYFASAQRAATDALRGRLRHTRCAASGGVLGSKRASWLILHQAAMWVSSRAAFNLPRTCSPWAAKSVAASPCDLVDGDSPRMSTPDGSASGPKGWPRPPPRVGQRHRPGRRTCSLPGFLRPPPFRSQPGSHGNARGGGCGVGRLPRARSAPRQAVGIHPWATPHSACQAACIRPRIRAFKPFFNSLDLHLSLRCGPVGRGVVSRRRCPRHNPAMSDPGPCERHWPFRRVSAGRIFFF